MTELNLFKARRLSAAQYVLALHQPEDRVAVLVRNRVREQTMQRIESVIQADGTVQRVQRSEVLGPVSEIPTRRQARVLLQTHLASLNAGLRRAEATMPFGVFVAQNFEPLVLPTLKPATREIYSLLLRKPILPRFRDSRLCEISRAEIQKFLLEKLKDGYAWETADHFRSVLSRVLRTAVEWNYLSDNPVHGVKMPERSLKRPHRFCPWTRRVAYWNTWKNPRGRWCLSLS